MDVALLHNIGVYVIWRRTCCYMISNIKTEMKYIPFEHNTGYIDLKLIVLSSSIKYTNKEYIMLIISIEYTYIKVKVLRHKKADIDS